MIRLDGLITKFMGETAAKLRLVFDGLSDTKGIYLFDEVDALSGERARTNDVGEIRRVLVVETLPWNPGRQGAQDSTSRSTVSVSPGPETRLSVGRRCQS